MLQTFGQSFAPCAVTVYAIKFESGETYVGMTEDVDRRFTEHSRRQSPSTKKFGGSFKLIYSKEFPDYVEARRHEKYLKSGSGRTFLKGVST
ncbi:hypothetical protein SDC9_193073 [bioreactor metagenome]|uniref:GIY-YIG domain-containing protein n=1 Tax=bioreactor metagenome TaxID=1076179 RepID=A0A645I3Q9_9ZZZZ